MRIVQYISRGSVGALFAVVAFVVPARAADVVTARLVVRVTASPGAPGRAVVTVVSEGSAGRARSGAADVAGPAVVFERIPPGAYQVTATLPGFATGATTLGVTAGEDLSITAVLSPLDDRSSMASTRAPGDGSPSSSVMRPASTAPRGNAKSTPSIV